MTKLVRATLGTVAITLALAPAPSQAIAPIIALLAKQMLTDMVTSTAKSMLRGSLDGMGCKGQALANAINSVGNVGAGRGMPSGMALHTMPGIAGMPGMSTLPGGMPMMPGMGALPPGSPDMAAMMARILPGGAMPPGMALDPEQAAMLAQLQGGMGAALAPAETLATIDEMSELGLLSHAMNTELKECMVLLPHAAPAMGMAMGMMKPMLPQFRDARDQMRALSPEEQDELAASLVQELDKAPAKERKAMLGELAGGLFPPRVVQTLNQRFGVK
ncbi:hypothetical protein [Polaromonas sp.]|uniref:hypothetical protein n=1 Tax=Polaromonas sp. TaxID=1869339 RepID=UPI0017F325C9|nr:hypothetical protein [Polaromonas sp.]NMM07004.1 hypothetical protein [Polaromonas sp.]